MEHALSEICNIVSVDKATENFHMKKKKKKRKPKGSEHRLKKGVLIIIRLLVSIIMNQKGPFILKT